MILNFIFPTNAFWDTCSVLFQSFNDVRILGIDYFGNFVEDMDKVYQQSHSVDFFQNLLKLDQHVQLPVEYARHALVIAKKI